MLRALAICDLADSTALIHQLGDLRAAELLRRHDRLTRDLLQRHGGREIDKTDGFLMIFERPVQAVAFALDYQRRLGELSKQETVPLRARVGIHVGEVVLWKNSASDVWRGAKPLEAEGMVKPVAARLMSIARPGQILLSGIAYTLTRRAHSEMDGYPALRWRAHGNYRFKGVPDPVQVHEVGEQGIAPFKPPSWSGKAHREIPWWRRPSTLAIEAAAAVVVIAVPVWLTLRSPPAIAFAARDWVVVGDFKNLTDDTSFDDSLQSAFRIGLEQSHHVNVLADLKARETLKLMQRDPDKTAIDRETGSEIAIRDGVRALILPSIAEIGGRVRVTAEVIDPHTQTTVYSESADGIGESSVLSSLDKVNAQLRVRLGEALATVTQESQPLEKVATKSLDALRAYSLGDKAYDAGDAKNALTFYRQAIKFDPGFARAYLMLSRIYLWLGQSADAVKAVNIAAQYPDRLSPREALSADAWKASLIGSQTAAIEKWKSLAELYPDYFNAQGHYAYFSREFGNQYGSDVVQAAEKCASPRSPSISVCQEILGFLDLGNEHYEEAAGKFASSHEPGASIGVYDARAFAASRAFTKAEAFLSSAKLGTSRLDNALRVTPIAIALDQGHWDDAWKLLDSAKRDAAKIDGRLFTYFLGIEASLSSLRESNAATGTEVREYAKAAVENLATASDVDRADAQVGALFAAYLAAHARDIPLAKSALDAAGPATNDNEYPLSAKMRATARAEIERVSGNPKEAISSLTANDDSTLYLSRAVLMQAYFDDKNYSAARDQANWLARHRGRAYAEFMQRDLLLPFNVVQSNLALLDVAESSLLLGDQAQARNALHAFQKVWPIAPKSASVLKRIASIQADLK